MFGSRLYFIKFTTLNYTTLNVFMYLFLKIIQRNMWYSNVGQVRPKIIDLRYIEPGLEYSNL